MPDNLKFTKIDAMAAVNAVNETLRRIDERLIDHGERVAFIACEYCDDAKLNLDMKSLFLLSIFHDIGAYKTEEIDRMVEFETQDVHNHSIYGYLFLKNMSPLADCAEAILYHHTPWSALSKKETEYKEYATLIHLADRIDIALHYPVSDGYLRKLFYESNEVFPAAYLRGMEACLKDRNVIERIQNGEYRKANIERCTGFLPSTAETLEYLKMIVYSIDYRSEHTVTHTVNTISLALDMARRFGLPEEEQEKIYLGALLHDVGKIAIPESILESPGRLNDAEMAIMRTHVNETDQLIRGIVPDEICEIAVRHHEKLDGSGYPRGLRADDLSFPQRIVAVADIVSALGSRRSYKEPFPMEKTIAILKQMSVAQLDPRLCAYVCADYEAIMARTDRERQRVIRQYHDLMHDYQAAQILIKDTDSSGEAQAAQREM